MANGLMITALFCLVRFWRTINPFILSGILIVGVFAMEITKRIASSAGEMGQMSKNYPKCFLKHHSSDFTPLDKRMLKSYSPLTYKIGGYFELNKSTFPFMMNHVVVATVVNLVVAFHN